MGAVMGSGRVLHTLVFNYEQEARATAEWATKPTQGATVHHAEVAIQGALVKFWVVIVRRVTA
jgi:hypothetical protein